MFFMYFLLIFKIFSPFFTTGNPVISDEQDISDNSGTGLGLYIIRNIIESHGGTISVAEPSEGYNTCFLIKLPSKKLDND